MPFWQSLRALLTVYTQSGSVHLIVLSRELLSPANVLCRGFYHILVSYHGSLIMSCPIPNPLSLSVLSCPVQLRSNIYCTLLHVQVRRQKMWKFAAFSLISPEFSDDVIICRISISWKRTFPFYIYTYVCLYVRGTTSGHHIEVNKHQSKSKAYQAEFKSS